MARREWGAPPEKPMTILQRVEIVIIAAPILWGYYGMIRGGILWLMNL